MELWKGNALIASELVVEDPVDEPVSWNNVDRIRHRSTNKDLLVRNGPKVD